MTIKKVIEDEVEEVFRRLPLLPEEDRFLEPVIKQDIKRKLEEGWSKQDILSCLRCVENFDPDLDEDIALRRMAKISAKYKRS